MTSDPKSELHRAGVLLRAGTATTTGQSACDISACLVEPNTSSVPFIRFPFRHDEVNRLAASAAEGLGPGNGRGAGRK
ncbi:hypothetical protein [Amycolatopsis sp. NPDC004378]